MSQPENPHTQRSVAGMVGSMIVVVIVVVAWVGFRSFTSENEPTPVHTVDWSAWAKAGRADHALELFAPEALPKGWRATSVTYNGGGDPRWHLGLLTDDGKYVGIEESRDSVQDQVQQYVDVGAVRGQDVTINGTKWQAWTDGGGDYAVALPITASEGRSESVLVGGSAPDAEIREFAASLQNSAGR